MTTSFSDLLAGGNEYTDNYQNNINKERITVSRGFSDRIADRIGSGVPKFKSIPPPSLPISPPSASPSSYFSIPPGLSPAELLDSPVLLSTSNILPSPTTGTFPAHSFNWKGNSGNFQQNVKQEDRNYSDFSFQQPQTRPLSNFNSSSSTTMSTKQPWNSQEPPIKQLSTDFSSVRNTTSIVKSESITPLQSFSPEISTIQANNNTQSNGGGNQSDYNNNNSSYSHHQTLREKRRSEDGYNWRKYGQKQVKGSENPRSYYKCTYPNCPTKKKVERSLDGQITEIVYKGSHNHPKPQSTRRSSSSSSHHQIHQAAAVPTSSEVSDQFLSTTHHGGMTTTQMELVTTPENSSISIGDDDLDQTSQKTKSGGDEFEEDIEPDPKRWKKDSENEGISAIGGSRTVREPRVVVQTTSDIDILDDGYRWRKYGQKVVKGNPNPRSYYKCTSVGCPVRKHVERACHDLRAVITTYEGKHNHDVPAARGSGSINRPITTSIASHDNNNNVHALALSTTHHVRPYSSSSSSSVTTTAGTAPNQSNNMNHLGINNVRSMPMSEGQTPFTLEMLQSPGSFGFSGFNNPSMSSSSYMNLQQQQHSGGVFSKTKEEPKDNNDMFLESLLY
ncbi:DNA-binding WRKY [Macleaya cordata]|uniref:DNA-binding WRKY n=1 Tax=Macleaya cordata TaxID=56857 RepID=A0A200R3B7_MACCD|nr:DNA-binding WRKY [Macleaya cordata]